MFRHIHHYAQAAPGFIRRSCRTRPRPRGLRVVRARDFALRPADAASSGSPQSRGSRELPANLSNLGAASTPGPSAGARRSTPSGSSRGRARTRNISRVSPRRRALPARQLPPRPAPRRTPPQRPPPPGRARPVEAARARAADDVAAVASLVLPGRALPRGG